MGMHPVYLHGSKDMKMFRLVTAQLIESGACRQAEIIKAFGVSKSSVIRSQHRLRDGGPEAFFKPRPGRKGGTVLTPALCEKAQALFNEGESRRDVSDALSIRYDTLRKAINDGRLQEPETDNATTKSERTFMDAAAAEAMGTACTRASERTFAAFGKCFGASVSFEKSLDVPHGGVLCALPALLANGLLEKVHDILGRVNGHYSMIHVLLVLAFMSLCRIKTVDQLKGHAPGEFGKLLGLDRVPEIKWLRNKMEAMSKNNAAEHWAGHLCRYWLESEWMREIRKLTESGHQTSLISTAYELPHTDMAAHMFSRWCQENFFGYMMEHFAIDLLQEYGVEDFPDTETVVNPLWREKDRLRNSTRNKLRYRYARFAELSINPEAEHDEKKHGKWLEKKAELLEEIEGSENQLEQLKREIKDIPKHITRKELKESERFFKLKTGRKRLMDTVRMIAYRAETAMVNLQLIGCAMHPSGFVCHRSRYPARSRK